MSKKVKKHWKKHKKRIVSFAQIISFLTILAGMYATYEQVQANKLEIKRTNQWVGQDFSNHTAIGVNIQKQVNSLSNQVVNLQN